MTFQMNASAATLARIFPDVALIERSTQSQDAEGAVEASWSTLHADVPGQFSPLPGDTEVRDAAGEFVKADSQLILQGDYSDIAEADRCTTRGVTFDIVAVQSTSYDIYTVLHLERRETDDASS